VKVPYDSTYNPPAPVLSVVIGAPDAGPGLGPFSALVDTGADGTFVPTDIVAQLGVPVEYNTNVRGHVGTTIHRAGVHVVDLRIGEILLPACEIVGDDWGSVVIVGRNVLNRLDIHLCGRALVTEVAE
jgi:hypothetical protein